MHSAFAVGEKSVGRLQGALFDCSGGRGHGREFSLDNRLWPYCGEWTARRWSVSWEAVRSPPRPGCAGEGAVVGPRAGRRLSEAFVGDLLG